MDQNNLIAAAQGHVLAKAAQDAGFRAELLANPRAAVEKVFGAELPAHIQIQVNEAPANTIVLNLPHVSAAGADGELSDGDLEAVAGGSKAGATKFFTGVGSVMGATAALPVAGAVPVAKACGL